MHGPVTNVRPDTAVAPPTAVPPPESGPRTLRLRYNNVFVPEYFSTIVISLTISVPFLIVPINGGIPIWNNPHAPIGIGLYLLCIGLLAWQTVHHRLRCRRVIVSLDPEAGVTVRTGDVVVPLKRLDRAELRIDRFFGRRVRALHLRDVRGHELVVHDALDGFDEFLRLVQHLVDRPLEIDPRLPEVEERIAEAWAERHRLFPLTVEASVSRTVFRVFFLIPVAFVDFVSNLWLNFELMFAGLPALAVYVGPITLLLSAVVNRYVSYYMLTSRRMNR
jgi:hypothetical protein